MQLEVLIASSHKDAAQKWRWDGGELHAYHAEVLIAAAQTTAPVLGMIGPYGYAADREHANEDF